MFPLSNQVIADALHAPVENVSVSWAALEAALNKFQIYSDLVAVASLATVRVECFNPRHPEQTFLPIHEFGGVEYFTRMYDITSNPEKATELGNLDPGDGAKYAGRGFIQLTGKTNYRYYGELVGIDLVADPDQALQPDVAAEIFALFLKHRGCVAAANAQDWKHVRKLVNGGYNNLDQFVANVNSLQEALNKQQSVSGTTLS